MKLNLHILNKCYLKKIIYWLWTLKYFQLLLKITNYEKNFRFTSWRSRATQVFLWSHLWFRWSYARSDPATRPPTPLPTHMPTGKHTNTHVPTHLTRSAPIHLKHKLHPEKTPATVSYGRPLTFDIWHWQVSSRWQRTCTLTECNEMRFYRL